MWMLGLPSLYPKVNLDAYDLSSLDKGTSQGELGEPTDGIRFSLGRQKWQ